MKKILTIVLVLLLCLSITACAGKSNTEHEYILSLLEKGDYDMAILVIEGIRDRELGTRTDSAKVETAPTEAVTEATTAPTEAVLSGPSGLVYEAVSRFLAEKDADLMVALPLTVTGALEYRLGNYDNNGNNAHGILVNIQTMVFYGNGTNDQLQLAMDLDSGKIYNSAQIDESLLGSDPRSADALFNNLVSSYFSRINYGDSILWCDSEIIEVLSQSDLDAVNEALK